MWLSSFFFWGVKELKQFVLKKNPSKLPSSIPQPGEQSNMLFGVLTSRTSPPPQNPPSSLSGLLLLLPIVIYIMAKFFFVTFYFFVLLLKRKNRAKQPNFCPGRQIAEVTTEFCSRRLVFSFGGFKGRAGERANGRTK